MTQLTATRGLFLLAFSLYSADDMCKQLKVQPTRTDFVDTPFHEEMFLLCGGSCSVLGGFLGRRHLVVVKIIGAVIIFAVLDIFGRLAEIGFRIEDVAHLAASQTGETVLHALEEEATVVLFGVTQVVAKHQVGRVDDGRAHEAEHLFRHAARTQGQVGEFANSRLHFNQFKI